MRRLLVLLACACAAAPAAARAAPFQTPAVFGANGGSVLRFPQAVAYDEAAGVVYVADQYSFLVKKFKPDGTFLGEWGGYGSDPGRFGATSGDGAATATSGTVGGIGGIAAGPGGDVYVLDSFNGRVEQFSSGGTYKRSVEGFNTGINGGVAIHGDQLYVADQNNDRVERFVLGADGAPVFAGQFGSSGTGDGQLRKPQGVAVDPEGAHDVFVADDQNHRVQRFSAAGVYEAQVGGFGSGDGQFKNPYDVGVDQGDQLYVADNQNHRVQRFKASTFAFLGAFGGFGTADPQMANVRSLSGIAASPSGGVYVGDTSNDRIDEFASDDHFVRTWGASGRSPGNFTLPRALAVDAQGTMVVADTRNDRIERIRADGFFLDQWGKTSSLGYPTTGDGPKEFRDPAGVAVDPATGEVYTVEGGNHRVQRFGADGTHLATYGGVAAGSAPGQFTEPLGVAVGPGGELVVADTRNDRLQRRDPSTGAWTVQAGFARPAAVAVDSAGRRYVAEYGAGQVRVIAADGAAVASIEGLDHPEAVAVDRDGRVVVADSGRHRVQRYVPSGSGYELETTLGGRGDAPGQFVQPLGVAVDAAGAVYVADTYNHRIQRFAPSEPAPSPAASATGPGGPTVAAPRLRAAARTAPRGLSLRASPSRDRRRPYRFTLRGRLGLPASVTRAAGCRGRVEGRVGNHRRAVSLRSDCTYAVRVTLPRRARRGRLWVRATFMGNATLSPRTAARRRVRAG